MQRTHFTVCAVCSACVTMKEGFIPPNSIQRLFFFYYTTNFGKLLQPLFGVLKSQINPSQHNVYRVVCLQPEMMFLFWFCSFHCPFIRKSLGTRTCTLHIYTFGLNVHKNILTFEKLGPNTFQMYDFNN